MNDTASGKHRLSAALAALGAGTIALALLGPFAANVIRYHASPEAINQVIGGDAVGAVLIGPTALIASVLVARGHRAGPVLALGPALYVAYTSTQLAIGADPLRYEGTAVRFFPLFVVMFVLAAYTVITAWRAIDRDRLPTPSRRLQVGFAVFLAAIGAFLLLGLHLPGLVDAWADRPESAEYLADPFLFWLVKWMDLAIIVPVMAVVAAGLLRRSPWSQVSLYAAVGWFAALGSAVAGMAVMMQVRDDPSAAWTQTIVFGAAAVFAIASAAVAYRPLFTDGAASERTGTSGRSASQAAQ